MESTGSPQTESPNSSNTLKISTNFAGESRVIGFDVFYFFSQVLMPGISPSFENDHIRIPFLLFLRCFLLFDSLYYRYIGAPIGVFILYLLPLIFNIIFIICGFFVTTVFLECLITFGKLQMLCFFSVNLRTYGF